MKVLIMVLSCMKPPYDKMYEAAKETWDSVEHENVKTVYYFGDVYKYMHIPFRESLKEHWDEDWDVIFRTNSSSYIEKNLLYEFIKDKSTINLWIGNVGGKAAGNGFFISRDLAKILKDNISDESQNYEDVHYIEILSTLGYKTERGQRTSYNHEEKTFVPCYQIRCRNESMVNGAWVAHDRYQDVLAFYDIFNKLNNKLL